MIRFVGLIPLALSFCAPVAPAQEADEAERRATIAVEKVGGSVLHDETRPGSPVTDIAFISLISDPDLELALHFPELEKLAVYNGRVTDAGLVRIATVNRLHSLALGGSAITDDGWAHLAALTHLEQLTIRQTPISDAGLVHLGRLTNVRSINLFDTDVTAVGVDRLKEALPYAIISVYRDTSLSDAEPSAARVGAIIGFLGLLAFLIWRGIRSSRPVVWKMAVVAVLIGVTAAGSLWMAPRMRPVKDADAGAFWYAVTGLDVGTGNPSMSSFYPPRDGWFICYQTGFHGQFLYRVDPAEARALLPKVVERLRGAPPGRLRPDVEAGFRDWLRSRDSEDDANGLMMAIYAAREQWLNAQSPGRAERVAGYEADFAERWKRAGRYSWNVWFEFAFLSGVILFAAWPWLRNRGRVSCAIHLGLTPVLFCLPFWLGYAPLTFTSAGDTEGVLYPRLLMQLSGLPRSDYDRVIVRALPKPLEPLSQQRGPMLSLSGFGPVGPVAMLTLGLSVGVAIVWGPRAARWVLRQGTRGKATASPAA